MFLECPNCSTHFKVPSGALGEVGRTVRCSRCAFEWFAEPRDMKESLGQEPAHQAESETEETSLEDFSEDVLSALGSFEEEESAEAVLERRAQRRRNASEPKPQAEISLTPAWLSLAASLLLLAAGALVYFHDTLRQAGLGALYNAVGMEESAAVKLANLSITQLDNMRRTTYMLQGLVVNTTESEQPIPSVRIRLMSEDGEVLREWAYAQPGMMKPKETLPFSANKLDAAYKNMAHHFQVDIGSGFEMALRD